MRYYSSKQISDMSVAGEKIELIQAAQAYHDSVEKICNEIYVSFSGVQLGDGIGLRQANGIDDYATEPDLQKLREKDEKVDWSQIPIEDLNYNWCAWSYFDPEGVRFHLPAFMIIDLRGQYGFSLSDFICDTYQIAEKKFSLLSNQQKCAVRQYLEHMSKTEDGKYHALEIERSIKRFWQNNCTVIL